jgi:hypothetical protein
VGEPMDLIDVETGANQTPEVEGIGRRVSLWFLEGVISIDDPITGAN